MSTQSIIAIATLVISVATVVLLVVRGFIKEAKRQTDSLQPMIEDYLTIMYKLDNISQQHELETVSFCIKIFKDAYGDIKNGENYLEEMNQLYKIKELEILERNQVKPVSR